MALAKSMASVHEPMGRESINQALDDALPAPAGNGGPPAPEPEGPGTVVATDEELGIVVESGSGLVAFAEVQPPGKRRMSARDWIHGRGVSVGQSFV